MKLPTNKTAALIFILLLLSALIPAGISLEWNRHDAGGVPDLAVYRGDDGRASFPPGNAAWTKVSGQSPIAEAEAGSAPLWMRITLPPSEGGAAVLLDRITCSGLQAYLDGQPFYEMNRPLHGEKLLIPIPGGRHHDEKMYIRTGGPFLLEGGIRAGDYGSMLSQYVKNDLIDVIIGAALILMAVVLLLCTLFLRSETSPAGYALVLIIFSSGVMVITYSPFIPLVAGGRNRLIELIFSAAVFTFLPAFTYFFEQLFGGGPRRLITKLRKIQTWASFLFAAVVLVNTLLPSPASGKVNFTAVTVIGIVVIAQILLLLSVLFFNMRYRDPDSLIFGAGFSVLAVTGLAEMIFYFASEGGYRLYWWKWGIVGFILSLIVIMGRRFALNHDRVVQYSTRLEKFNNELQRSEKMEIISELAASVAHEVRNPLQVTRGFLQILGERSAPKEKEYLQLAIAELDRASMIITDFLTFAKPEMQESGRLDVLAELKQVAGILAPLGHLQGVELKMDLQQNLYVTGNASKFKQALINLIKNAIEAMPDRGTVTVGAWSSGTEVIVSVRDNGIGMTPPELARLGEPYYSNKTKGTGLGLMVTYRIVEAMNGELKFYSHKGVGTQAVMVFPAAD
ncbi:ATP-binding protein [Paenibacillus sp. CN-4]|uniref:ATP-binding protein n=1 Tax=Paenibacillus nanchangensis TaxID=3348343 RepID=UPI00397DE1B4